MTSARKNEFKELRSNDLSNIPLQTKNCTRTFKTNVHYFQKITKLTKARRSHYAKIMIFYILNLTLPVPCISENYIEIKIKLNFYFHTSL